MGLTKLRSARRLSTCFHVPHWVFAHLEKDKQLKRIRSFSAWHDDSRQEKRKGSEYGRNY
jgi:hypothetical protein